MNDYYGDNDRHACAWLRELIAQGHLPQGKVDEKDIKETTAADVAGFRRVHMFAGIGGWGYALELAGWPTTRPVWTASCPCQPFSVAGKRKGQTDERHLWPVFFRLVRECKPATIFGEQVSSDDGYRWLARVRDDLEEAGYAVGCADIPACSTSAPHKRSRLFFVADADAERHDRRQDSAKSPNAQASGEAETSGNDASCMDHADGRDAGNGRIQRGRKQRQQPKDGCSDEIVGDSALSRPQEQWCEYRPSGERCSGLVGLAMQVGVPEWNGPTFAVECSDGPRRVSAQPDAFPLAHGVSGRMGMLRGAGNAIVPQVAAQFIRAFLQTEEEIAANH